MARAEKRACGLVVFVNVACDYAQVYDRDLLSDDDLLGHITLPLWHLISKLDADDDASAPADTAKFPTCDEMSQAHKDAKGRVRRWYELVDDYKASESKPLPQQLLVGLTAQPLRKTSASVPRGVAGGQARALQLAVFAEEIRVPNGSPTVYLGSTWSVLHTAPAIQCARAVVCGCDFPCAHPIAI